MNNNLRIKEAADFLGISVATLRRWDTKGRLAVQRKERGEHRLYSITRLEEFLTSRCLELAEKWIKDKISKRPHAIFYCPDSSIFQARLYKLRSALSPREEIESFYSLLISIVGEIGDNSFGHNIGNWPDITGIFFGYDIKNRVIVLADRGQGVLKTLKRVKPELVDDSEALRVAFTEVVSGRYPENRGNGLKYVRQIIEQNPFDLFFQSGEAKLSLGRNNLELKIKKTKDSFRGCLAIIRF
ncbi:MAG: helix-turn-helix domain-containing protein [Patescibacteria group bacterium]|jgi:hypothetical protein